MLQFSILNYWVLRMWVEMWLNYCHHIFEGNHNEGVTSCSPSALSTEQEQGAYIKPQKLSQSHTGLEGVGICFEILWRISFSVYFFFVLVLRLSEDVSNDLSLFWFLVALVSLETSKDKLPRASSPSLGDHGEWHHSYNFSVYSCTSQWDKS